MRLATLACPLLLFAMLLLPAATRTANSQGKQANPKKAKAKADSEEIKALLTKRRDVLKRLVNVSRARYTSGGGTLDSVLRAQTQLLDAELELAASRQARVDVQSQRVEVFKQLEQMVRRKVEAGITATEDLLTATAARLAAEVDLLRERIE